MTTLGNTLILFRNIDHGHTLQPAISLHAIFSRISLVHVHQKTQTKMFKTALFHTDIHQQKHEQSNVANSYSRILYSNEKLTTVTTTWMNLRNNAECMNTYNPLPGDKTLSSIQKVPSLQWLTYDFLTSQQCKNNYTQQKPYFKF